MKYLKLLSLIFAFAGFIAISACNSSSSNEKADKMEQTDKDGPEYTSEYVCPMHCEGSGSEKPGECPVCGMAYVMNEELDHEGHDHGDHEGHNH